MILKKIRIPRFSIPILIVYLSHFFVLKWPLRILGDEYANQDTKLVNEILHFLSKVDHRKCSRRNLLENLKEIYFSSDVKTFKKELRKIAKRENYHEVQKYEELRWEVGKIREREKRREIEFEKFKSQNQRMTQILEGYQKELENLKRKKRKILVDAQIQSAPTIDGSILKQKDEIITKLRNELTTSKIEIPDSKDLASENRKLQRVIIELEHGVGESFKVIIIIVKKININLLLLGCLANLLGL